MKKLLHITLFLYTGMAYAQIEINPSSINAELNLKSQTKGMFLPRINKPADVNSPQEGILIYNKESKTPAFHDGSNWRMMSSTAVSGTSFGDSTTYTVVSGFSFLTVGTYSLGSISLSGINSELASSNVFQLSKPKDANTIGLIKLFYDGKGNGVNTIVLEIKVFRKGASSPYFSYKFKNMKILVYSMGDNGGSNMITDNYTIQAKLFGWWDYTANAGTAYDFTSGSTTKIDYSSF